MPKINFEKIKNFAVIITIIAGIIAITKALFYFFSDFTVLNKLTATVENYEGSDLVYHGISNDTFQIGDNYLRYPSGVIVIRNNSNEYIRDLHLISNKVTFGYICYVPVMKQLNDPGFDNSTFLKDNYKAFNGDVKLEDLKPAEVAYYNLYGLYYITPLLYNSIAWKDVYSLVYDGNKTINVRDKINVITTSDFDYYVTDTLISNPFLQFLVYVFSALGLVSLFISIYRFGKRLRSSENSKTQVKISEQESLRE